MVFAWSLSDYKSTPVSGTLLRILNDLNNAVVRMVSTRSLISKSSSLCTNPSVTVPSALITISITVIFKFHSFFFSSLSLFFGFTIWSTGTAKCPMQQVLFFIDDYHKVWSSGRD